MRRQAIVQRGIRTEIEKVELAVRTGVADLRALRQLARLAARFRNRRKRNKKRGLRRDEKLRRIEAPERLREKYEH